METGKVNSWLLYLRRSMVVMKSQVQIRMRNSKNGTNHEETSCGMDRTVSKLYRIVRWSVRHLCR